jgi:hypothetical protein
LRIRAKALRARIETIQTQMRRLERAPDGVPEAVRKYGAALAKQDTALSWALYRADMLLDIFLPFTAKAYVSI